MVVRGEKIRNALENDARGLHSLKEHVLKEELLSPRYGHVQPVVCPKGARDGSAPEA